MKSLIWLLAIAAWAAPASSQDRALRLDGASVLSSDGQRFVAGRSVWLGNGRILRIAARDEDAADVEAIDCRGLLLIPGLIDLHSHLLLRPYDQLSWSDQVLRESLELRTIRATVAARDTLAAGFTTLRDLGTEGAGYADVALRNAVAGGVIPGPRIFAATRALVATGCYGPSGFDPRWRMPVGAQVADGADGVRIAVREQIAAGADWIKVYADYRRSEGGAATPTYSSAELAAIVDEAASAGVPVAAHAVTDEGIRRAVLAGARTIEHATGATRQTLQLMVQREVALCPTLTASESMARYSGWLPGQPPPPRIERARRMFALALAENVTIACGSDVGVFRHGDNAREIELMVEWGMAPPVALRAATAVAAQVLGRERELGRIAEGMLADLVLLRGNPLESPSALRQVAMVIQGGRIAIDRR